MDKRMVGGTVFLNTISTFLKALQIHVIIHGMSICLFL